MLSIKKVKRKGYSSSKVYTSRKVHIHVPLPGEGIDPSPSVVLSWSSVTVSQSVSEAYTLRNMTLTLFV